MQDGDEELSADCADEMPPLPALKPLHPAPPAPMLRASASTVGLEVVPSPCSSYTADPPREPGACALSACCESDVGRLWVAMRGVTKEAEQAAAPVEGCCDVPQA